MHRILIILLMALSFFVEAAPSAYSTLDALQNTPLPPADSVDLAVRLRGVTRPAQNAAPEVRSVGMAEPMRITRLDRGDVVEIEAELRAIGEHVYMWIERGLPIPDSELEGLAAFFDDAIYEQVRALWGSEPLPGVDGDPRVHILFARDLGSGTGAYYARRHTFPQVVFPGSNEREMFFVNVDAYGVRVNSRVVQSTLAHEFQHMIRDNVNRNEASWLNEGLSVFTQHALDLGGSVTTANAFFRNPDEELPSFGLEDNGSAADYGAGFLFAAYFHDRYGQEALRALAADERDGLAAFDAALEEGVGVFFADWVLANLLQDTTIAEGQYGYATVTDTVPVQYRNAVTQYPFSAQDVLGQYATHYYLLENPGDSLTVTLDMPPEVALIPTAAASGDWMWYSQRGDVSNTRLTRAFDLTNVTSATLAYDVWYDIEEGWDYAYVSISTDGGQSWSLLATPNMTASDPHGNAFGTGYSGASEGWLKESIVLDAYTGHNVLVRFETVTDESINLPGLALDDIAIPEMSYFSDFESDDGGWQSEGWVRMDNRLPQQMWVQAVQRLATEDGDQYEITRWRAEGSGQWVLPLEAGVETVSLALSPFAPMTTERVAYTLRVE